MVWSGCLVRVFWVYYWTGVVTGLGWLLDWDGLASFRRCDKVGEGRAPVRGVLLLRKKGVINCYKANP